VHHQIFALAPQQIGKVGEIEPPNLIPKKATKSYMHGLGTTLQANSLRQKREPSSFSWRTPQAHVALMRMLPSPMPGRYNFRVIIT
jgi:hypothetical protein